MQYSYFIYSFLDGEISEGEYFHQQTIQISALLNKRYSNRKV